MIPQAEASPLHQQEVHRVSQSTQVHQTRSPQQLEAITRHQLWLQNPTTQQVRKVLQQRKGKIVERLQGAALHPDKGDHECRVIAIELAEIVALERMMFDTEEYVKVIVGTNTAS